MRHLYHASYGRYNQRQKLCVNMMLIASFSSVCVVLPDEPLFTFYTEPKRVISVEKSHENNVLSIMLIISIPPGYYKCLEEKRLTLRCRFLLSHIFFSVSFTNTSLLCCQGGGKVFRIICHFRK